MPFTTKLEHWQKAVRTMRACFAIALDTQMKHGSVKAKVFLWTICWKRKLMMKVSYGTSLEIWLIKRIVQWKISTACTAIIAYKVAKWKPIKTLSARRICHNILNVWFKCGPLPVLCSSVSTQGWLKPREWKTRDGRKVTVENPKPTWLRQ